MRNHADFLVEIQTAELPPKALQRLASCFLEEVKTRLTKLELSFGGAEFFATPRRLAVYVKRLAAKQPDSVIDRKGPAVDAAFDQAGKPTPACLGFARSCNVTPDELTTLKTDQGAWVAYQQNMPGKSVQDLLPELVQSALSALPIPKRMRWGSHTIEFVRPVHSVLMLYGNEIVDAEILGCRTGNLTRGHRFHSKGNVTISSPASYLKSLEKKFVIADFARRKGLIREQANAAAKKFGENAFVQIQEDLLDEVTGLVEWPVAIGGSFDASFLSVPQEALISAMQDHQRYFPVVDQQGKLLPHFITISNIESVDASRVIAGNERVLRARLSDAAFFYSTDKKYKLMDRIESLKHIVYQAKLGSLYDKTKRVATLAVAIAKQCNINSEEAERAGLLSKTDLTTAMVGEFPELQGVMGYYYALQDGESKAVAKALNEQYMPRFSGDVLPETLLGCVLALADRIDTIVGVFGINQAPTGDKDPLGLRRSALGVLRILIEKKLNCDLCELLALAAKNYTQPLENPNVTSQALAFLFDRLKPWYQDQGVSADVLASVTALDITKPYDFHRRVQAVQEFKKCPEAASLSVANKRVSNILAKCNSEIIAREVNADLFEQDAEKILAELLAEKRNKVLTYSAAGDYAEVLSQLAGLRHSVDDFFEKVLVMDENSSRRENRLLLLKELRELFLHVADIALLQ